MSTPDDYRAMAEECFRWARQAQTEDKRQAYLDVARTWLEAASGQDCGPPAQMPTLWPLKSEALMGARLDRGVGPAACRTSRHSRRQGRQTEHGSGFWQPAAVRVFSQRRNCVTDFCGVLLNARSDGSQSKPSPPCRLQSFD